MKIIKTGMRLWITVASIFSFLIGWAFFAHSNKPAPLQVTQPAQENSVLDQPLQQQTGRRNLEPEFLPFTGQSQFSFARPRLRTGGS